MLDLISDCSFLLFCLRVFFFREISTSFLALLHALRMRITRENVIQKHDRR